MANPQPESHVERADPRAPMPVFPLKASDLTADLCVDFWQMVQRRVKTIVYDGLTPEQAVQMVRESFGIPPYLPIWEDEKLNGAARIAAAMRAHSPRKLAD